MMHASGILTACWRGSLQPQNLPDRNATDHSKRGSSTGGVYREVMEGAVGGGSLTAGTADFNCRLTHEANIYINCARHTELIEIQIKLAKM